MQHTSHQPALRISVPWEEDSERRQSVNVWCILQFGQELLTGLDTKTIWVGWEVGYNAFTKLILRIETEDTSATLVSNSALTLENILVLSVNLLIHEQNPCINHVLSPIQEIYQGFCLNGTDLNRHDQYFNHFFAWIFPRQPGAGNAHSLECENYIYTRKASWYVQLIYPAKSCGSGYGIDPHSTPVSTFTENKLALPIGYIQ
jgi:hypothetical protein